MRVFVVLEASPDGQTERVPMRPAEPVKVVETEPCPPAIPDPQRIMIKLKKDIGDQIWAVTSQQHYIVVHGNRGSEMMLYRFCDALQNLAELDGLQIHRSHWVARDGVESVKRCQRRYCVVLKNGLQLPISQSHLGAVKTAGWFQQLENASEVGKSRALPKLR